MGQENQFIDFDGLQDNWITSGYPDYPIVPCLNCNKPMCKFIQKRKTYQLCDACLKALMKAIGLMKKGGEQ